MQLLGLLFVKSTIENLLLYVLNTLLKDLVSPFELTTKGLLTKTLSHFY